MGFKEDRAEVGFFRAYGRSMKRQVEREAEQQRAQKANTVKSRDEATEEDLARLPRDRDGLLRRTVGAGLGWRNSGAQGRAAGEDRHQDPAIRRRRGPRPRPVGPVPRFTRPGGTADVVHVFE